MEKGKSNKVLCWVLVVLTIIATLILSFGGLFCVVVGVFNAINSNLGNTLFFIGLFLIALGILSLGLFNAKKILQNLKERVANKEGK